MNKNRQVFNDHLPERGVHVNPVAVGRFVVRPDLLDQVEAFEGTGEIARSGIVQPQGRHHLDVD